MTTAAASAQAPRSRVQRQKPYRLPGGIENADKALTRGDPRTSSRQGYGEGQVRARLSLYLFELTFRDLLHINLKMREARAWMGACATLSGVRVFCRSVFVCIFAAMCMRLPHARTRT